MRYLAWCCGAFALAVLISVHLLPSSLLLPFALASVLLSASGLLFRIKMRKQRVILAGLFAFAGFLAVYTQNHFLVKPCEELVGCRQEITVRAAEYPTKYDSGCTVTVRLISDGLPAVKCSLSDYSHVLPDLAPGDELRLTVRFVSALKSAGEETDSYTSRGIFLRAYTVPDADSSPQIVSKARASLRYFPQELRRCVTELCSKLFPADVAGFQTALLIGEKQELYGDYPLYYALSRAGLMHVTAVSGMHVAFLTAFILLLVPDRRRAGLIALPALVAFSAAVGFSPSVVRAVFMQLCFLAAAMFDREEDAPTALLLILALLLAVNPRAAGSVSLQLSFAAAAGILLFSGPVYTRLMSRLCPENAKGRLYRRLCAVVSASVSCSLGALILTTPLTALHFGSVSLISPLTNILCTWLISTLFLGGYAAVLLGAFIPAAGEFLAGLVAWGDRYVFFIARLLQKLPFAALYTQNRAFLLWLVLIYALFLAAWIFRDRKNGARFAMPSALSAAALILCIGFTLLSRFGAVTLSVLDVGQGASALLESRKAAVLIDCGGSDTLGRAGETAGTYTLSRLRTGLDALILTHTHRDHANGLKRLLALVDVSTVYLPRPDPSDPGELDSILAAAGQTGTNIVFIDDHEELCFEGIALSLDLLGAEEREEPGLFILAECSNAKLLFTGDADASLERKYIQQAGRPDIDVLIVGHHGSAYSTDEGVLNSLSPELALISVGYNTYGHPSQDVLDRLSRAGVEVHRTDEEGTIFVRCRRSS